MKGKEKCKALKEIRKQIAENNDIEYVVEECKHKGDCKGTCPKCEAELRYLEKELVKKQKVGQKLAVLGVSMGIAASFSGCDFDDAMEVITYPGVKVIETISGVLPGGTNQVDGDMGYVEPLGGEDTIDPGYFELEGEPTIDPDYIDPIEYTIDGEEEICPIDDDFELEGDVAFDPEADYTPDSEIELDFEEEIIDIETE